MIMQKHLLRAKMIGADDTGVHRKERTLKAVEWGTVSWSGRSWAVS